jgi:predicted dehydrogenase
MRKAETKKDVCDVGIVGCGSWGTNYIRICQELPQVEIAGISDVSPERLASARERFPFVKVAKDVRSLLRSRADAVIVATPAATHYGLVREALEAGKHVLVEKPITTDADEAGELVALAKANGLALVVGHTFLFNAGMFKVKELMRTEDFGQVYYIHCTRTNLGPVRQDVNVIWDLATHDVAIANFLLDKRPEWVSAVGGKFLGGTHEDIAFVTLGYPQNVLANIHASWLSPNKVREVVVIGNQQRIVFDDLNSIEPVRVFKRGLTTTKVPGSFGEFRLLVRDGDIYSPRIPPGEPLGNQMMHFLECIRRCRKTSRGGRFKLENLGVVSASHSDGACGLEVVRVLEAVVESLRQNGSPIKIER